MNEAFDGASRAVRVLLASGLAVLLAGCMLVPGKFASEMVLLRDGTFSYSYDGEIHLLSMGKLAQMGAALEQSEFAPDTCFDEETMDERECSAEELAQQRADYAQQQAQKAANDADEARRLKEMFGGIDPTDPASGDELASRIERQAGFDAVVHKGDGVFDVRFRASGRLDHDFIFPTFERLPAGTHFVFAGRRDDGSVRIDAPGFAALGGVNPVQAMMNGLGQSAGPDDMPAGMPGPEGTFTLITDGEILANNTDEGPAADPRGKKLTWVVGGSMPAAPTALIKLRD